MITRPLNLASHLRAEPRNFDFLFLVNAGLLALFFTLFGSRFVLSPGLAVDFRVPEMRGARAGASAATREIVISVKRAGLIVVDEGPIKIDQLRQWLRKQGESKAGEKLGPPSLLVIASAEVTWENLAEINSAAQEAGFAGVTYAAEELNASKTERR
jgi:biopolymer transport protein ExbD